MIIISVGRAEWRSVVSFDLERVGFPVLVKARLGRPHYGFQTWPPRSSVNSDQPKRQL